MTNFGSDDRSWRRQWLLQRCFTSAGRDHKDYWGRRARGVHFGFNTAPELCAEWAQVQCCFTDVHRDHKSQLDQQWLKLDGQDHFDLRPQKRGCLLGTGDMRGRGRENEGATADTARKRPERPWTAARTMEVLRPCPPLHCAATSALSNCCFNCRAGQSQGQCPLRCCWGTTRSERSPTFAAQLHLSPCSLYLLGYLRVQLHLLPLALAWNPVVTWWRRHGPKYRSLGAGDNDDHHDYPGWSALTSDNRRDIVIVMSDDHNINVQHWMC